MRKLIVLTAATLALAVATPVAASALSLQGVVAKGSMMTVSEITLLLFTLTNSVRLAAYLPQIWKAATTDSHGVRGISCLTWSLFLVSNLATVGYAVVNLDDWVMAAIFLANAAGCAAILGFSAWRQVIQQRPPPPTGSAK